MWCNPFSNKELLHLYNYIQTEILFRFRSKDGGAPIIPDRRRRLKIVGNTIQLALDEVQKSDAGLYTVTAKSPSGTAFRDVELRVNKNDEFNDEPPALLRRLNDLSVKVGTRTRFLVELRTGSDIEVNIVL